MLNTIKSTFKGKPKNYDGTMSLVDHLQELRSRLLKSIGAIFCASIFGLFWYSHNISIGKFTLISLGDLLKQPYCSIPSKYRASFTTNGECKLLATGIQDQLLLMLKVATVFGIIATVPVWFYQIWKFITPGLKSNERKYTLIFVFFSSTLFLLGALLAFFITPKALSFLLAVGRDVQVTALSGEAYFGFVISFMIIFGISFELPLVMVILNFSGVLAYNSIKKSRRTLFFLAFLFAGIATPGQDPYSMTILAIVLILLLEIAIRITQLHDRSVKKKEQEQ